MAEDCHADQNSPLYAAHEYGHFTAARYVDDVAALVGESPEAWRGVLIASSIFTTVLHSLGPVSQILPEDIDVVREVFGHAADDLLTDEARMEASSVFAYDAPMALADVARQWVPNETFQALAEAYRDRSIALLNRLGFDVEQVPGGHEVQVRPE